MRKKTVHIGWVILAFIFFWPVFIYLVYKNMKDDDAFLTRYQPTNGYNTTYIVIGAFIILISGLGLLGTLSMPDEDLVSSLIIFILMAVGGIACITTANKYKIRNIKYQNYYKLVTTQNMSNINQIASTAGFSPQQTTIDLQAMVWGGFLDGYVVNKQTGEVVPRQMNQQMRPQAPVQNRPNPAPTQTKTTTVRCAGCGANNVVIIGQTAICEYCDTAIKA